jgi:putative RNA 2'-phosphotransferase
MSRSPAPAAPSRSQARALTRASRFVSLVLRHQPEAAGLTLDREGWAQVDALIAGARAAGVALDRPTIEAILRESSKTRFALSADGARIRALQGHSTPDVALDYEAVAPPDILYHGTIERFLEPIFAEGLRRGERHHVHLSGDVETARIVGARRGAPVVLRVAAGEMAAAGHAFYRADNGVWLTQAVPARYLERRDED